MNGATDVNNNNNNNTGKPVVVLCTTHAEKKAKLDENPIVELRRQATKFAVVHQRKKKEIKFPGEGAFDTTKAKEAMKTWLLSMRQCMPLCYHNDKKGMHADRQCTCLAECDLEITADFCVKYCLATANAQDMMVRSILQTAEDLKQQQQQQLQQQQQFGGNQFHHGDDELPYRIFATEGQVCLCVDGFLNLLKIGGTKHDSMKRANEEGVIGRRIDVGSVNSTRNSSRRKAEPSVIDFLKRLAKDKGIAVTTTTKNVVDEQGEENHHHVQQQEEQQQDDNEETEDEEDEEQANNNNNRQVLLPAPYSKKGIYRDWCFEQGYHALGDRSGPRIKDFKLRTDDGWKGKQPGPICSIACFVDIWQKDCAFIQIRNPFAKNNNKGNNKGNHEEGEGGGEGGAEQEEDPNNDVEGGADGEVNHNTNNNSNKRKTRTTTTTTTTPHKKAKPLLSDKSGHPYTALREAHETLLQENQQLRERFKDEKESYQEEIQQLKERVHYLETHIRSTRGARGSY